MLKEPEMKEKLETMAIGDTIPFPSIAMRVTRVPGGYLYYNEYCGITFVPETAAPAVRIEPKRPGRPPKVMEK